MLCHIYDISGIDLNFAYAENIITKYILYWALRLGFVLACGIASILLLSPEYSFSQNMSDPKPVEIISKENTTQIQLILAATGASGIAGLFWGIYQYREARNDRRKETFFTLTKDFDHSKEFHFAKKILDTWALDYNKEKGLFINPDGEFSLRSIRWILSVGFPGRMQFERENPDFCIDKSDEDLDEIWRLLRDSFDAVFDFFERLAYLYAGKRITTEEIQYFRHYIKAVKNNPEIFSFLDTYDYSWHKKLPSSVVDGA